MILRKIKNWLIGNILCASVPEDVLEFRGNKMYVGGVPANEEVARQLAEDAMYIRNSRLWSIMVNTLRKDSEVRMFTKSTTFDDMWAGKMMQYNLSVQEKILNVPKRVPIQASMDEV